MAEPQQGMRRRYVRWNEQTAVPPPQLSSNADQEARASLTRFSANLDVLRGLYNRLTGDDAAAEAAYGRALQTQQEAARQDSDVSTNWRDWGGVGDAAAGVRKVLTGSAPDMALALGAGGVGRGLARRTVGNIERRAAVQQVEQRLANDGIDSLVGRKVAENAARKPVAAAASPRVAQAQFQDAIDRTGADLVRRAPGAQGRIDAAGRAGFIAGSTAGAFPGIAAQDTQELSQTDREGTLRMLPYQIGQAALEPLVEARLAGRALGNPYVKEALQEGLGATRGALSKLPGRVAKETVQNAATEAGTEGAQALLQTAGQRAGRGEDPLAFTADDWAGALDQAIVGGLAGGAMGGSVEVVNASVPAAVDAAGRAVRAGADAGRWAWDKTGGVRQALRERIRAAAEKRRSPLDAMDGGADPGAQDAPADLGARAGAAAKQAFDTAGALFDKAKQGLTGAAQRFRGAQGDLTQADELDAQADGAMDFIDRAVFPAQRNATPDLGEGMTGLHDMLARGINPDSPVWKNFAIARTLVNGMHDYVTGVELTPVRQRMLTQAFGDPNSNVTPAALDFIKERVGSIQSALDARRGKGEGLQGAAGELAAMAEDPESGVTAQRGREVFSQSTAAKVVDAAGKLRDLKKSLGSKAETSQEFDAARKEHYAARVALHRALVAPSDLFVRNGTAPKAFDDAVADPGNVLLVNKKDVYGNGKLLQPRAVRLSGLIGRAREMMRQEGTPDANISAFKALQYALGAMQLTGDPVDVTSFKPGDVKDAKGNVVMRLTPANIKSLAAQVQKLTPERKAALGALEAARPDAQKAPGAADLEKDLEFVRSGEPGARDAAARDAQQLNARADSLIEKAGKLTYAAAQPYYDEAKALRAQARALARAAMSSNEVQGYNESEYANDAPLSSFRAETPPEGTRNADGTFTPNMGVVSDVRVSSPHAATLRELYTALRKADGAPGDPPPRDQFDNTADYDAAVNKWSAQMRVFTRDMRKYSDRVLAAGPMMAARFTAGQKIGAAELEGDLLDGKISKAEYDAKLAELQSPENPLAEEYLTRALQGEFDSASASLVGADDPQFVNGVEGDFGGGVRPPGTRELIMEARADAARKAGAARAAQTPEERARANTAASRAGDRSVSAQTQAVQEWHARRRSEKAKQLRAKRTAKREAKRTASVAARTAVGPPAPNILPEPALPQSLKVRLAEANSRIKPTAVAGRRKAEVSPREQLSRFKKAVKESSVQNDELAEQTDAIDAGATSASSDGRHNLKAERSMLNTILGMLGITEQIRSLRTLEDADEQGNKGGSYVRRSRAVSINPNLHGAERVEVLMHELGHHIIWNEIAKYVEGGFDALQGMTLAESIDVLAKGNPKLYAALRKDFDQWNTNGRPAQSPTHRYLRITTNGLSRTFKDDHHAFHEWFADNIARSLAGKRPVVGVVGKFFAKIATQLRKAWSVISATPSLKPAPSVDAWVKQMLNANVAAVKEATGQAAPQAKAEATVRGAVAAQAAKAGPVKYTMENLGDLVALIETVLPVESRQLLDRVFARPVVLSRLQQIYADNPVVKRMLDHPSQGASARIAFGYLAWQDGLLKTGPQGQNALLGLSDSVLRLFGAAGDGALAQRTLYDIQTGAVQRFKDAGKIYSARDLAARNGSNFQRALNWVNRMVENSPASNALAAFWTGNNTRMRESGIPALRTLATMLDRPQGSVGEANPGLITNIRVQTARWNRQMREALEPLTDRQRLRVLRALQRRAKAGDKAYDALPEAARAAADTIRAMFRDAYRYQREAGYTEDDLGHIRDYMPVIMDVRNENARAKLTALYSKPEYARDVAIAAGFVKPDKKGLYDGAEVKAVTDDPKQMAKAVEYLVRAAANDGQTPPPAGAAGRFHFRHQNTQLSAFIYRHGNPDDIKTLASLQTRDPGEVFGRYFAPMVRWSEMARMFGEPEQVLTKNGDPVVDPTTGREVWHMNPRAKLDRLLEKVKQQGGTDADTAFADNAVRAALGVYGADGSPTIAAISPWAAEKLKGRKAQSVIEGVQAYQNARLLPLALLSNLVDPVGIAVRTGGEFGVAWDGFKEGMGFVRAALAKDPVAAKRLLKELEDIDVSEDFLPALAANPVFEGGRTGKARAVNDFVFKWNGVQTWVTATRVMAMYAGHKFLLRHAQQPNEHSLRYLQELGLQAADIVEDPNNPGKVEINDKTRAALRQFVDEAILRPNSQQAPLWMSDPYMGIVMQYKMFAYAIWEQIGGRIGREITQGNMRVVAAALMYLPVIIMAELTREMIQTAGEGDDRRKDWGALEYTKLAADRSGLLGPQYQIMGDIMGDIDRARLPGTSQLGPSLNQGSNVLDALQGQRNLGKEFESALPGSPLYRKWNDDMGESAGEAAAAA